LFINENASFSKHQTIAVSRHLLAHSFLLIFKFPLLITAIIADNYYLLHPTKTKP